MNLYLIALGETSGLTAEIVEAAFPEHHAILPGKTWAVATNHPTAVDVARELEMEPSSENHSGVVVRIDHYYGLYDKALWIRLFEWERKREEP